MQYFEERVEDPQDARRWLGQVVFRIAQERKTFSENRISEKYVPGADPTLFLR